MLEQASRLVQIEPSDPHSIGPRFLMAAWLDCEQAYSIDELAAHLEVDPRFFKVAESAGLTLDVTDRISLSAFWLWFGLHFAEFRHAAGMRPSPPLKKTLQGFDRDRARAAAALLTIIEFFGVLPCDKVVSNAAKFLKPRSKRRRR